MNKIAYCVVDHICLDAGNLKMNMNEAIMKILKNQSVLPKIEELIGFYDEYSNENVHVFTLLLLLSASYRACNCESKIKVLSCIFGRIFPTHFKNVRIVNLLKNFL